APRAQRGGESLSEPGTDDPFRVEHDESDDALEQELDREATERPDPRTEALTAQLKEMQQTVVKLTGNEEAQQAAATVTDKLTSDPADPPDVDTSDPTSDPGLDEKKAALDKAKAATADTTPDELKWTVSKYLVAASSFVAVGLGVFSLIDYLRKRALHPTAPEEPDVPQLDAATKKTLDKLHDDWKSLPDGDYWHRLADYIDGNAGKLSLGDQLVFMNLTVLLGGLSGGFLWDSAKDESDLADQLVAAYRVKNSSTDMIRAAATLKYGGNEIPRVVTAQLLQ